MNYHSSNVFFYEKVYSSHFQSLSWNYFKFDRIFRLTFELRPLYLCWLYYQRLSPTFHWLTVSSFTCMNCVQKFLAFSAATKRSAFLSHSAKLCPPWPLWTRSGRTFPVRTVERFYSPTCTTSSGWSAWGSWLLMEVRISESLKSCSWCYCTCRGLRKN